MVYDDIIIGSGLAALGVAIGLPESRKVLVLGGAASGSFSHYDRTAITPCAYQGRGGLGNYWHGVIATGMKNDFASFNRQAFARLFHYFYPNTVIESFLGQPKLFVPWRPIRPSREFKCLVESRDSLSYCAELATHFKQADGRVTVYTATSSYMADRIWLAAGALHTPQLLNRSLAEKVSRDTVSDHVICYVGQVLHRDLQQDQLPIADRGRDGVIFSALYGLKGSSALFTLKPARFAFSKLDYGIEARAIFGLSTGGVLSKLARSFSPGLLAEAVYNKTGLFAAADKYNVYAQVQVKDAYNLNSENATLSPRAETINCAIQTMQAKQPMSALVPTRRSELFLPGIHLHGSVELKKLENLTLGIKGSRVQLADASIYEDIGCDHHSFKVMLAAAEKAHDCF